MTGEDLRYKPKVVEHAKFHYFPLGKVFNKGLDKDDQKEAILKRLKNIEGKNIVLLKLDFPLPKNCVVCIIESPLKIMKNAFYFMLKALLILMIFNFL